MKYMIVRIDAADVGIRKIILYVVPNFGNNVALGRLHEIENRILRLAGNPYMGIEPRYPLLKKTGV